MQQSRGIQDTAGPGQHAELEALKTQAFLEAAHLLHWCGIQILWDVSAYYDSIGLVKLIVRCNTPQRSSSSLSNPILPCDHSNFKESHRAS